MTVDGVIFSQNGTVRVRWNLIRNKSLGKPLEIVHSAELATVKGWMVWSTMYINRVLCTGNSLCMFTCFPSLSFILPCIHDFNSLQAYATHADGQCNMNYTNRIAQWTAPQQTSLWISIHFIQLITIHSCASNYKQSIINNLLTVKNTWILILMSYYVHRQVIVM